MTLLNHIGLLIVLPLFVFIVYLIHFSIEKYTGEYGKFYPEVPLFIGVILFTMFEAFYWTIKIFFL